MSTFTTTVSPGELAERVTASGGWLNEHTELAFLKEWEATGIAEERDGGWRLTERGSAMFGGFAGVGGEDVA